MLRQRVSTGLHPSTDAYRGAHRDPRRHPFRRIRIICFERRCPGISLASGAKSSIWIASQYGRYPSESAGLATDTSITGSYVVQSLRDE
jgi:hypothetical protein